MPYSGVLRVPRPSLRIAVVQFAPKIGHVQQNIEKARTFCESLAPGSIDLLCLPEMIFTGKELSLHSPFSILRFPLRTPLSF